MPRREPLLLLRVCTLPFETLNRDAAAAEAARSLVETEDACRQDGERLADALHRDAGPAREGQAGREGRHALLRLRRDVHNQRSLRRDDVDTAREIASPEALRLLDAWQSSRAAVDRVREEYVAAHDAGARREWKRWRESFACPLVAEAVRLASRSLAAKVRGLAGTPVEEWGHRDRHAALKALAYAARFATKTSPNGLFCATAVAGWGERTCCAGDHRLARLDYALSVAEARKITACLGADSAVEAAIVPRPNPTIRRDDEHWTLWKPASPRSMSDDEVLTRIRVHPVAQRFLDLAGSGRNVPELIAGVAERAGFAADAPGLRVFYDRLVEHGVLIAEIEIPYAERRPLLALADRVEQAGLGVAWVPAARAAEQSLDAMADRAPAARLTALDALQDILASLPHRRALREDELVRVDAASALRVTVAREHLAEARRFLEWYAWLFSSLYPERLFMAGYARRFLELHPADQDVSALDLYHGMFEPAGEGREWGFPRPKGSSEPAQRAGAAFDGVREALAGEAARAAAEGRDEVALERIDWERLLGPRRPARWHCGFLFQLAPAARDGDNDAPSGPPRRVVSAIYPGLGLAVARLAHLHARDGADPIGEELARGRAAMSREGAVLAEVTYMHGARTANAGLRPSIFEREIELPGDLCSPAAERIRLADLVVRYESASGRFVLRCCAGGAEVIPTLSSGISPEGFVSFLLAVGRQGWQPLSYYPGFECAGVRRWPRFTLGNTVVFRRRWEFEARELPLSAAAPSERFLAATHWRLRHGLPLHVFVSSAAQPKPFFVDLGSPTFVDLFAHWAGPAALAPDVTVHVTEMLPRPEDLWVRDATGRYASEFLVQLGSDDA